LCIPIVPFAAQSRGDVVGELGKVVEEQVEGLVGAFTGRNEDRAKVLWVNELWSSYSSDGKNGA
jgi:hypothetical protein